MNFKVGDLCIFTYGPFDFYPNQSMECTVTKIENNEVYVKYHTTRFGHSLDQECTPVLKHLRKATKLEKALR